MKQRIELATIGILFALFSAGLAGCASLPAKQKAVIGLQAAETALEAAHDTERAICAPAADKTKAITKCDGPNAATLGLTDARHQQLAVLFSRAFDVQGKAAVALTAWRAGDPAPTTVIEYSRIVNEVLALVQQFLATTPALGHAKTASAEAARVVKTFGG